MATTSQSTSGSEEEPHECYISGYELLKTKLPDKVDLIEYNGSKYIYRGKIIKPRVIRMIPQTSSLEHKIELDNEGIPGVKNHNFIYFKDGRLFISTEKQDDFTYVTKTVSEISELTSKLRQHFE